MGEIADAIIDRTTSIPRRIEREMYRMSQTTVKNTDTKVVTGEVRFSYVNVFEPYAANPGDEPRYSVSILIPKDDKATLAKIDRAIKAAIQQGLPQWGKQPANLKLPIRDGDVERPDDPAYAGHYFINARSKTKPGIVDARLNEIINSDEFYSGCYGRASINFYPFNVSGNRGIAAGLNNLQKLRDGEYLGGRSRPEDDFEAVETDEGADGDDFLF